MSAVLKHATSSVFLFAQAEPGDWRLGLIHHPRLLRWMLPGGHVEADENPAEAALREVAEETGHRARLISPPGVGMPHTGTGRSVAVPLWIAEYQVPDETRHPHPHIHVDYLYLAIPAGPQPEHVAELSFAWYAQASLDELDLFSDTRARAHRLFARIGDYTRQALDPDLAATETPTCRT
jgi:8-oxo-dGTP pyrophosphatase MutT (NUDIX family)